MHLIELSGISRTFQGEGDAEVGALRNISLQIEAGEFVCITGPSGAGKSTLMHILGCLDRPTGGSYRLAGREIGTLGQDGRAWLRRKMFGFVFQGYNLIESGSASENVELPGLYAGLSRRARSERAESLLSGLGLAGRAAHLPAELSGGEQQRVAIARSLMNGGRIILGDEPTGALDRAAGDDVLRELEGLAAKGHTVVIVSHNPEVAKRADRRIELVDGRISGDTGPVQARSALEDGPRRADKSGPTLLGTGLQVGRLTWRNLRTGLRPGARLRTLLPILCMASAVSLGSLALSAGEGLLREIIIDINMMGLDIIRVGGLRSSPVTSKGITVEDGKAIQAEISNIRAASPMALRQSVTIRRGAVSDETAVWGLVDLGEKSPRGPLGYRIAQGGSITRQDDEGLAQVVVIGSAAHEFFFAPETDPIGEFILIEDIPFRVKGVLEPRILGFEDPSHDRSENMIMLVPFSTGAAYLFDITDILSINVFVQDTDHIHETAAAIRDLGIRRYGHEAFGTNYPLQFLAVAQRVRAKLWGILGALAGIILLAGSISISIIMLMSVRTRRREIGIRMAVGARKRDILWQFLGETLAICVASGVLGVSVGVACLPLLAIAEVPVEPSVGFFALPFAIALAAGALASVFPARRAARLDPVSALAAD